MTEATESVQRRMDIRWWSCYKRVFKVLHKRDTNPETELSGVAAAATDAVFTGLGLKLW